MTIPYTVPNVVGLDYQSAQLALLAAGFRVSYPNLVIAANVNPGYVTAQSQAAGLYAPPPNDLVAITVAGFETYLAPTNTPLPYL